MFPIFPGWWYKFRWNGKKIQMAIIVHSSTFFPCLQELLKLNIKILRYHCLIQSQFLWHLHLQRRISKEQGTFGYVFPLGSSGKSPEWFYAGEMAPLHQIIYYALCCIRNTKLSERKEVKWRCLSTASGDTCLHLYIKWPCCFVILATANNSTTALC